MIEVTIFRNNGRLYGFEVLGHADYAPEGQEDILCAAVSVLTENTVNSIERLTGDAPVREEVREEDGYLYFELPKDCSENAQLLMESMVYGLIDIQMHYEKHLTIRSKEE